jgi:hypothetical protein
MVVTRKNAVFWDVMLCVCCKNRCFRGTYRLQDEKNQHRFLQELHRITSHKTAFSMYITPCLSGEAHKELMSIIGWLKACTDECRVFHFQDPQS